MEWQPIETAPRDGTVILLAYNSPFGSSSNMLIYRQLYINLSPFGSSSVFPATYGKGESVTDEYPWGVLDADGDPNALMADAPTQMLERNLKWKTWDRGDTQ